MRNGTVEPAVLVVGGENASLGVVPPFLQQRKGVVGGGNDVLQAVRADRIGFVLCGCIGEVAVGDGREEVWQRRFVVIEESDGSCVKSKLNSSADFGD